MVKLTFSSDYYEKAVKTLLRETKLSKLKGRLYSQVIENKKIGDMLVGQWLLKHVEVSTYISI